MSKEGTDNDISLPPIKGASTAPLADVDMDKS